MKALRRILFLSLCTSSKLSSDKNSRMRKRLTAVLATTLRELAPRPLAVVTDAFSIDWGQLKGYAFPPFNLIPRTLMKVISDNANLLLVAPVVATLTTTHSQAPSTSPLLSNSSRTGTAEHILDWWG